jgi:hypothetical protein
MIHVSNANTYNTLAGEMPAVELDLGNSKTHELRVGQFTHPCLALCCSVLRWLSFGKRIACESNAKYCDKQLKLLSLVRAG